jgi:hypothetical protein
VKKWTEQRNLSSNTDESLSIKLETCWELHLGQFSTLLKTMSNVLACHQHGPQWLREKQQDNCLNMWHDFKERLKMDPEFLLKIITGD